MNNPDREQQKRVNDYFQSTLAYWDEIYREGGVYQTIYQRRRTVALSLVDKLALPAGSRVLEVGCAHGLTTVALAERGDRKSTRLNSSHRCISYAVFCLKKKKTQKR